MAHRGALVDAAAASFAVAAASARPVRWFEIMRTRRRFRSSFVVTVGAASALLGACGGVSTTGPADGGTDDSGNPAGCPATMPTSGTACAGTESCTYGNKCSPTSASCNNGTWSVAIGNPPAPMCPSTQPTSGAACDCYPSNFQCPYAAGMCNGLPNNVEAICSGGTWTISRTSCNPPAPDSGIPDAHVGDASVDANHTD